MSLVGAPSEWVDLIDTLVPDILDLVAAAWQAMPPLASDMHEDPTTESLCRLLRQHRNSSELPFQIHIQMVELDPSAGEDQGRMDIAFSPLVPRENIYFCLECKRLNVVKGGRVRAYSAEYVNHGMIRFIRGQYAKVVRHGGMLGYVLDANVNHAIRNVSRIVQARHRELGMSWPGEMLPSSIRSRDPTIRETRHSRGGGADPFQMHHIFVPGTQATSKRSPKTTAKHRSGGTGAA